MRLCFGLIVAAAAASAVAQPFVQGSGQGQSIGSSPQRAADRSPPQRDAHGPPEVDRGRMSPDERRQLRRDIQEAGRDIYRRAPPAPALAPGHFGRNGRR